MEQTVEEKRIARAQGTSTSRKTLHQFSHWNMSSDDDEDLIIVTDRDLKTPSPTNTGESSDVPGYSSAVVSDDDEAAAMATDDDVDAAAELEMLAKDVGGEDDLDEPPAPVPSARQIVSIGNGQGDEYAFTFHEDELNGILSKVPAGWKVCVVSVVGAFRTGKSFLLSWFLRYLEANCTMRARDGTTTTGSDGKPWHQRVQTLNQHEGSFDWRGGKERNTTGVSLFVAYPLLQC